jgi:hypothetical protein
LIEISNATPERRKSLNCSICPVSIQKLRRCHEPRFDFTEKDAALFPMYVEKGGTLFGFCPGKATWDSIAAGVYQALVICAETGIMLEDGPLSEQPDWWVELLSWFLPYYSDTKFYSRARSILGSGDVKGAIHGGNSR